MMITHMILNYSKRFGFRNFEKICFLQLKTMDIQLYSHALSLKSDAVFASCTHIRLNTAHFVAYMHKTIIH